MMMAAELIITITPCTVNPTAPTTYLKLPVIWLRPTRGMDITIVHKHLPSTHWPTCSDNNDEEHCVTLADSLCGAWDIVELSRDEEVRADLEDHG